MPLADLLFLFALTFSSRLPATLSGQVRTADGTLVPGVRVELAEGEASRPLPQGTTDARGRYRLAGLRPGPYTGRMKLATTSTGPFAIRIAPGENHRDLTLRGSVLRGRVLSPDGEPAARAGIDLSGDHYRDLTTGEDGGFAFLVPAGSYTVSARKYGYVATQLADPVEVTAGSLTDLEFRLGRAATLRGHLLGLTPEELQGASVQVARAADSVLAAVVEDDGSFEITGLTPGTWWVRSWSHEHGKHAEAKAVLVEGGETIFDLPFSYHRVRGRAVDSEGNRVADRKLRFQTDSESATTLTSHGGAFELEREVHDGLYTVETDDGGRLETLRTAEPLSVDGSLPEHLELRLMPATSTLRGQLLGLTPEEAKMVGIIVANPGAQRFAEIDGTGHYEIGGLTPGEWKIIATYGKVQVQAKATVPLRGATNLDIRFPARPAADLPASPR